MVNLFPLISVLEKVLLSTLTKWISKLSVRPIYDYEHEAYSDYSKYLRNDPLFYKNIFV